MAKKYIVTEEKIINAIKETVENALDTQKNSLNDIVWITYGADKFDVNKFNPITVNWRTALNNKPATGGLWACPINAKYGWKDWCKAEDFDTGSLDKSFKFKLRYNTPIYVIDTKEDLIRVSTKKSDDTFFTVYHIDYERLIDEGFCGIYVTDNGRCLRSDIRVGDKTILGLSSWDVESICVFFPEAVVPV